MELSFGYSKFDPEKTGIAYVYKWALSIGPLEIRRWANPDQDKWLRGK